MSGSDWSEGGVDQRPKEVSKDPKDDSVAA